VPKETLAAMGARTVHSEVQIYFSEYNAIAGKGFSDIWLTHQITRTRNGQTVEDMHIKNLQLNPHLKPKQFEKKQ